MIDMVAKMTAEKEATNVINLITNVAKVTVDVEKGQESVNTSPRNGQDREARALLLLVVATLEGLQLSKKEYHLVQMGLQQGKFQSQYQLYNYL